nr:MAG TPA: hypothetical protein [Caudoviricetes sp.]DAR77829.1 MAG TPA: hypothetical protein [Caudoviricetes sp.]
MSLRSSSTPSLKIYFRIIKQNVVKQVLTYY